MTIEYAPLLYNVAPAVFGLPVAVPYVAGSGAIVLQSAVGLPSPPFRLAVCTLASAKLAGPNKVYAIYAATAIDSMTNVVTIPNTLEGTSDRNFAIGDLAGIWDNAGAITDLNNLAMIAVPTIATGIVASGNSSGTATVLSGQSSVQEVSCTGTGQGVMLPPIVLPSTLTVVNIGSHPILIYPQPGSTIYNSTSPITLNPSPPGARLVASSTTNWYSI